MVKNPVNFTSRLTKGETVAALAYLPVHLWLLPLLLQQMINRGAMDGHRLPFGKAAGKIHGVFDHQLLAFLCSS